MPAIQGEGGALPAKTEEKHVMLIRTVAAGALLALAAASPTLPQAGEDEGGQALEPIEDIAWSYGEAPRFGPNRDTLQFTREGHMSSFDGTEASDVLGERVTASLASPGEAVSFSVRREAGALACTGTVVAVGKASGTCRFDPEASFADALRQRGLAPEDSEKMFVLALVDARLASVDALSRDGFAFDDVDTVVAVSALDVTPGFARALRDAGLVIDDTDNLIAAKAVGVDPAWLRGMTEAGYANLDADQAIQMRALDITPDYARKMSRVIAALEGTETE